MIDGFAFEQVVCGYGDTLVVRGVGGAVAPGRVLGVLGRNGVGKTTLLRALAGFLPLAEGRVHWRGRDLAGIAAHARLGLGIAYAPQENVVFGELSVADNLWLHLPERSRARYAEAFAAFPLLEQRLRQRAGSLSGGERKLLSFARTLGLSAPLTLLDEPTEGVQPENIERMAGLLHQRGAVLVGQLPEAAGRGMGFVPQVELSLADPPLQDPLPLYAPPAQPLPNAPHYGEHLLAQCRRLVLGQAGLTVVLLDDDGLRRQLASGLAAEFGSRVGHELTAPESNGVICCGWRWWLDHQHRLPLPCQLVAATLPIASLEDPLTAARVAALRLQGRDWFRELLLPEALGRLQRAVAGLRRNGGRLAVLDGRIKRRGWGRQVLEALEPWVALQRLLPS